MVTLADLRARRTLPNWQEAVAIVQALFEASVGDGRGAGRLPDVGHIGLNADGTIALLPHSSLPEHPVRHLAVLLSLLLEGVPAPEPLLAIAERNLKAPPEFATPDEFTRSLRYFERPGRDDDIKALVARAEDAREEKPVLEELGHLERRALELLQTGEIPERHVLEPDGSVSIFTRDRTASLPGMSGSPVTTTVDMPGTADARPVRRRDLFGALRLLVVVAAVGAAVYWFVGPEIMSDRRSAQDRLAETAPERHSARTVGSAAAPSAASGSPGSAADRRPFSARRSPDAATGSSGAPAGSSGSGAPGASAATAAPAASSGSGVGSSSISPAGPPRSSAESDRAGEADAPPNAAGSETDGLYSASDQDVLPPVLLGRQPPPPPPDAPAATYEVVVDTSGHVEQIRLTAGTQDVRESMLRAHLKSWKFRPATRGGQPVPYRIQLRLAP